MYKIAVLGDKNSIQGFLAIGLSVFSPNGYEEAKDILHNLVEQEYGIIYITEEFQEMLQKEIDEYADSYLPAIIPIPGVKGNTGKGMLNVKKSVERAVGSDIIFGND